MHNILFFMGLLWGLSGSIHAPFAYAESLMEALQASLKNNPSIEGQRAALNASKEGLVQARASYLPTLNAQGGIGFYAYQKIKTKKGYLEMKKINGYPSSYSASLNANLNVFNGFQSWHGLTAAKENTKAQELLFKDAQQEVLLNAAQAYYDVWYTREAIQLSNASLSFAQKQQETVHKLKKAGSATQADVSLAKANYLSALAAVAQAQADVAISESQYEQVIGHKPDDVDKPPQALKRLPFAEKEILEKTLANNPSLLSSFSEKKAAQAQVEVARGAAFYPSVDIQASYSYETNPTSQIDYQTNATVAGVLTLPLYEGGASLSKMRQEKEKLAQALYNLELAKRQITNAVHVLWEQSQSAYSLITANDNTVQASQLALTQTQKEYEGGANKTLVDVLQAQKVLLSSQLSLIDAKKNACIADLSILRSMGQLDLQNVSNLLTHI